MVSVAISDCLKQLVPFTELLCNVSHDIRTLCIWLQMNDQPTKVRYRVNLNWFYYKSLFLSWLFGLFWLAISPWKLFLNCGYVQRPDYRSYHWNVGLDQHQSQGLTSEAESSGPRRNSKKFLFLSQSTQSDLDKITRRKSLFWDASYTPHYPCSSLALPTFWKHSKYKII